MDAARWELRAQALHIPGEGQRERCSSPATEWKGPNFHNRNGSLLPYPSVLMALNQQLWPESLAPIFSMALRCCGCAAGSEAQRQTGAIGCFLDNSPWAVISVGL